MDFVILFPPPWQTEMPPLWPAMVAATLRSHDYTGRCHDLNTRIHASLPPEDRALWSMLDLHWWSDIDVFEEKIWPIIQRKVVAEVAEVLAGRPRVIGFSTTQASVPLTLRMARLFKEASPETTIIVGGPSVFWIQQLEGGDAPCNFHNDASGRPISGVEFIDVFLRGEGEHTIPQLFHHLSHGLDPLEVPGAIVMQEGRWRSRRPPSPPNDLDSLPFPDFSDLVGPHYTGETLPFLSSRGCPRSCVFCNEHRIQGKYRRRSASNLVAEVLDLHRRYKVKGLCFLDLVLNADPMQLEQFCDELIAHDLGITWGGQAIVSQAMRPALLRKMARAGCTELTLGVESLSQEMVTVMEKQFLVEDAYRMISAAGQEGIGIAVNILVGVPGETDATIRETARGLEALREGISRVQAINTCHITLRSALEADPARFQVNMRMDNGPVHWDRHDGNNLSTRLRWAETLRRKVEHIGLPLQEMNLYKDLVTSERSAGQVSAVGESSTVTIDGLVCLDEAGLRRSRFKPGVPVTLSLMFSVHQPVPDPAVRLQLFNKENPQRENKFIFGTNTARCGVKLGELQPGSSQVRLHLHQLNLQPGAYSVTVGLWPDAESEVALDAHHGLSWIVVTGKKDDGGVAWMPGSLEVSPLEQDPGPDGAVILDGQGAPATVFSPGAPLVARAVLACDQGDSAFARIFKGKWLVHERLARTQAREVAGDHLMELRCDALNLQPGRYRLEMTSEDSAGQVRSVSRQRFEVRDAALDGSGLAFCPVTWELCGP